MSNVGYVDYYLISLPKKNYREYKRQATVFGRMMKKLGALSYVETIGDDVRAQHGSSTFLKAIPTSKAHRLVMTHCTFRDKKHRNAVMKQAMQSKVMADLLLLKPIFESKEMRYGGFKTIVAY